MDDEERPRPGEERLPPASTEAMLAQVRRSCAGLHRLRTKMGAQRGHFRPHGPINGGELLTIQERGHHYMEKLGELIERFLATKKEELSRIQEEMTSVLEGKCEGDFRELAHTYCSAMELPFPRPEPYIQTTWFTIFRLRFAFFLLCTFSICLSLFTGFLMEMFFAIVGANPQGGGVAVWLEWHFVFWSLPFLMMFLALLGDEMCDLMLDSFDDPPLNRFQGVLLAVLAKKEEATGSLYPSCRDVLKVDRITFFILELVPILVSVLSIMFLDSWGEVFKPVVVGRMMFMGYVQGSLLSALLATVLFVLCDARANWRNTKRLSRVDWLSSEIDRHKMNPYSLFQPFMRLKKAKDGLVDMTADQLLQTPQTPQSASQREESKQSLRSFSRLKREEQMMHWDRKARMSMYVMVFIWTAVVCLFAVPTGRQTEWYYPVLVGLAVVITVTLCSYCLHKHFREIYGAPYVCIVVFFIFVAFGLNMSTAVKIANHSDMEALMTAWPSVVPNGDYYDLPARWDGAASLSRAPDGQRFHPYPLCEMSWGSPEAPVRALDLASLAWIVYQPQPLPPNISQSAIADLVRESFPPERRVEVLAANDYDHLPRFAEFYFHPTGNSTQGTVVVAVKGTSTTVDVLVDTNLFSTIQVLQFFQTFLPVLTILPRLVIQWLLQTVHISTARSRERLIWSDLEHEVRRIARERPQDHVVLTGHSLGGGLAQIVAARTGLGAVVWSAPGAAYSAKRFGIEVQALKRDVVTVMPDHDVVPRVDLQAGMLQLIECRTKHGAEASAPQCHLLLKTACEVWRVCGDSRDFRRTCSSHVAREDLGRLYSVDDSTS